METWRSRPPRLGVLASGGAPNLHLAAGALCAFYQREISFDVIGASGAGALAALLYAVPKQAGGQVAALRQTVNINVSDAIYQCLPMNYKVFFKSGPFSEMIWRLGRMIPHYHLQPEERLHDSLKRLYNDSIDFMISAITPTTLNYFSKGVCTRVGVINDLIAWDRLAGYPGQFFLNAFDLKTQKLQLFDKTTLTPETFWAALAMPWLFAPAALNGTTYTEGASHDPAGLEALWECNKIGVDELDMIVALDTVGPNLWNNPVNIYDALQMAIIDPIVSLAEYVLAAYGRLEFAANECGDPARKLPRLYRVPFEVPDWEAPHILEWNHSNALTLWDVGHDAARRFARILKGGDFDRLEEYRYYGHTADRDRTNDFLALFDDVLAATFPSATPRGRAP
jgi:NTE family protein